LSVPDSSLYNSRGPYLLNGTVQTAFIPYLSLSGTSQAAPVVAGTVALMLEANPALTPNVVKAILQYTAEIYPGYDPLTQGAGFLNARGAVELARFLASPSGLPYPSTDAWSRHLIWGNFLIDGGRLTPTATAWRGDVVWGARSTPTGERVEWGERCAAQCDSGPVWEAWGLACGGSGCTTTASDGGPPHNVVWGASCGGTDCPSSATWSASDADVWGTSDDEIVVWGTESDEIVVWGTTGDENVVWGSDTESQ
jgi:hypothetical protein